MKNCWRTIGGALLVCAAVAVAEESAWTQLNRGIEAYQKKDYRAAQAHFEMSLRLDPECGDAHYYLGVLADQSGDKRAAVAHLKGVPEKFPTYGLAQGRLGLIALKLKDTKSAEAYFKNAVAARPDKNSWLQLAAVQLDNKNYEEAEKSLAETAKLAKDDLQVADLYARLYMETKRPALALDHYSAILKKVARDSTARYLRSICYFELQRPAEAVADLKTVLGADPYHGGALRSLIEYWKDDPSHRGDVAEMRKRLERLKKAPPRVRRVKGEK